MTGPSEASLREFRLLELLHEGASTVVYRATDRRDQSPVVLKHLAPERATPSAIARLRHEHAILEGLEDPGIVRALELYELGGGHTLVLRDIGGETLAAHLERERPGLRASLELAIKLCELVAGLHARRVIHKDLNPRNVLINAAGAMQLIDFGVATKLPRELAGLVNPNDLEGTLDYIAPEQTGRMNRPLDHRADLYSLGGTLYRIFAGRPPFTCEDPAELVHAHIALTPESPRRVTDIPTQLSEIIMRLLAKSADARYQSARGLLLDLRECARQLRERGAIEPFPLGRQDRSDRLELPHRLYGRDEALSKIVSALERVRAGGSELVLVKGPAGIGKSALVHELQRDLSRHEGLLVGGKYDLVQRDIPYSGLLAALAHLAPYLLAETPARLERWRVRLREAVGESGRLILDTLPDFAALLGDQRELNELSPEAARGRMHETYRRFIHALARRGHPLVLLLDDLQWADAATLELLPILLDAAASCSLLLLGSYRDDEVAEHHALRKCLAALERAGLPVRSIELGPLAEDDVRALLRDALSLPGEAVAPLAARVHAKTGGNPFFVGQFLKTLHATELLEYDLERARWVWELAAIDAAPITDNVIDILERRARAQGQATLRALRLAACVGTRFDATTLARIDGRGVEAIEDALLPAIESGLIDAQVDAGYRFVHDRVREAVYGTIEPGTRTRTHLYIGRYMLKRLISDDPRGELFDALNHINRAEELLEDPRERERVAWLNLSAGRKAQAAAAFESAAEHYAVGRRLLPAHAWSRDHERAWLLLRCAAECEFVLTRFDAARELFVELYRNAQGDLQRAEIENMRVALYMHRDEHEEAIARGRVAMSLLGSPLPTRPGMASVTREYLRARVAIGRRTPEELLEAPRSDDPRVQLLRSVIYNTSGAAFGHDENLMLVLAMRAAGLSARHGNTANSAAGFITYGLLVGMGSGDYGAIEAYGQLSLKILERMPNPSVESLVRFLYAGMVIHWTHPIDEGIEHVELGFQRGLEGGNMVYAALCKMLRGNLYLHMGRPLDSALAAIEQARAFGERVGAMGALNNLAPMRQLVRALRGETAALHVLDSDDFDERAFVASVGERRGGTVLAFTASMRLRLAVYARRFREARQLLDTHGALMKRVLAVGFDISDILLQEGIVAAALKRRRAAARAIRGPLRKLDKLAERCPANFLHKAALLRAERLRVSGDGEAALTAYTKAIDEARARGFLHDEALARELCGRYFLGAGALEAGHPYLARARQLYARWGAHAKVALLDQEFPGLERLVEGRRSTERTITVTTTAHAGQPSSASLTNSAGSGINLALDLRSVLRASEAFATEMDLSRLQTKVMQIAVENAGAERGVLVLARDGELVAELEYTARSGGDIRPLQTPLAECTALAAPIALLAHRKREPVVLEDAAADPVFGDDPWVRSRGAASILCAPILHQGESLGVLYLENSLAAGVFTPARLETLKVLAVQAAISIQHVMFYERLEAARLEAEAASQAKSRFLANMSHELRTPLNAILGYTELTVDELQQADGNFSHLVEDLQRVHRSGELLLGIIGDILDLTKIEAGTLALQPVEFEVDALLSEVADAVHPQIQYSGNELRCSFEGELGPLRCDPQKLRQVLFNLLNNANKFTEDGTITLGGRKRVDSDGSAWVELTVADTGIGMTAETRHTIFEAFNQADNSSTRQYGGAGLGLTIVRKLCERMGARVSVDSVEGEGSVFTVSLRALNAAPARAAE